MTGICRQSTQLKHNASVGQLGLRAQMGMVRNPVLLAWLPWLIAIVWLSTTISVPSEIQAAELSLPEISPQYRIQVKAPRMARETRGSYDVLAFDGGCQLQQGEFKAAADEIILWVERSGPEEHHPGKIIVYLNGSAVADWGQGRRLQDQRWMGRLFSIHPIETPADIQVGRRHDIPNLDWSREPGSPVQLAQFAQSQIGQQSAGASNAGINNSAMSGANPGAAMLAPPLLGQSATGSGPGQGFGLLPAAQNVAREAAPAQSGTGVPHLSGAIPWGGATDNSTSNSWQGGTLNSELLPSSGIVIPENGSLPYPAAGIAPLPSPVVAAFPAQAEQVVRQVTAPSPFAAKSFQFLKRGANSQQNIRMDPNPERGETTAQITGGFKLVVSGVQVRQPDGSMMDFGTVSLEADNAVAWWRGTEFGLAGQSTPDRPLELYLDGNIVFHQGNRVIYADRMYYNVSSEYGMVLDAEVLTPVPQYQGLLRLKADVLRLQDRQNFAAYGAALTTSRLGVPRYWLQADEVSLTDTRDETDLSVYAPTDASRGTNMRAQARNNYVYLGGVPIFYWPTFGTRLQEPSFYLSGVKFKNDQIFGTQVYTEWNIYQALGIQGPEGTSLTGSVDYLSERGPAVGAHFDYQRPTWFFGAPGTGFSDAWFINDQGLDVLGLDRKGLQPDKDLRGRILGRNRLFLSPNVELMAESGYISDRNFLEQYFEKEWDTEKDFTSGLRLRRYNGNRMFDVSGNARVNDFYTETESLPRFDHYWLGQDLFGERFTYNAVSSAGYLHQRPAEAPTDPIELAKYAPQPWESDSEGVVASTRQELSYPLALGAFDVVPYISGEAAFYNEDVNQDDETRLTGQAGLRSSLPFWRVYPNVENRLFDLRGIAHKVTLESDFFYADSNKDLSLFPLYDPLDDNSQEHFRRRFVFNTFGGTLPGQFDESNYAFRNGMQRWLTAGSRQVVDDLTQARFGVNQRWQTKRGLAGRERVVDLVTFDTDFIFYPQEERDNFGESIGAINYDFRYHVGDRLTLLSDGYFDVFSQGLKSVSAGAQISRPGRGDAYIGMLSLEGPISANILNGYTNYRLNDKWILTGGAAFDFGKTGSIGQNIALTRIGETALVRVGVNIDSGRDNVSFNFNIEPRFLPTVRLGSLGGELIPPVGLFGLE